MTVNHVTIEISKGEMFSLEPPEQVALKDIGPGGALGLWDGFGRATVRINGEDALTLHLHRDKRGRVVLEARDPVTGEPASAIIVTS